MNLIKNKAKNNINNLKKLLIFNGFNCGKISEKKFNFEFEVRKGGKKFKLLVYFGKKGVKNVVQGNASLPEYFQIKEIVEQNYDLFHNIEKFDEPGEYIGTDETGKGDVFGPLVAAAVFVNSESKERLKRAGVRDSKNLTPSEIKRLAKEIVKIVDNNFAINKLEPAVYNQMYSKVKNLNKLLWELHSRAIRELLGKVKCEFVITDKFQSKQLDVSAFGEFANVKFLQEYKGEKFVGVAAASILARAVMVKWFEQNKILGMEIPKGASQKAEEFLKFILTKFTKEELVKFVKLNFKSVKKFENK